jgi:hypothetical protein
MYLFYLRSHMTTMNGSFIQASYCRGALHFPGDLTLEPRRMLRQFIPYIAQRVPFDYTSQANVVSVESKGKHCIVKDAKGNVYTADKVFVCSGAEYRTLFPEFFQKSGLKICKLQMIQTVPQPQGMLPHSILSGLSIQRYPAFKSCPSYHLLQEQAVDENIRNYGIHLSVYNSVKVQLSVLYHSSTFVHLLLERRGVRRIFAQ